MERIMDITRQNVSGALMASCFSLAFATPAIASPVHAFDASSHAQAVEVTSGSLVTVSLEANPSTGYHWLNVATNPAAGVGPVGPVVADVKLINTDFVAANPGAIGTNGVAIFTYKLESVGIGSIKLEERSPSGALAQTIEIGVTVTNPTTQAPSTPQAESATQVGACRADQLKLTTGDSDVGMSKTAAVMILTNTSTARCTLRGYPTLIALDDQQQPIPNWFAGAYVTGTYFTPVQAIETITLAPSDQASFVVETTSPDAFASLRTCIQTSQIQVQPPDTTQGLALPANTGLYPFCRAAARVTPITSGVFALSE